MLVQYYYPQTLSPDRLDRYLADGWFRGANVLCKSRLVCFESDLYSVMNIRLNLENYSFRKSLRKLNNRNGRNFRAEIGPASVNETKEQLYQAQKHRFKGFVFDSLTQFLYSDYWQSVFKTYEVCVYDGDQLIAVSFFDVGNKSMASILGLYNPAYKKYSLGIYTMLLEIQYAMDSGMQYYYPGYVLDNYPQFDYKLRLGDMEYYDWQGNWQTIDQIDHANLAGNVLKKTMESLQESLLTEGLKSDIVLNPFFSIGYLDQVEEDFLQSSIFLQVEPQTEDEQWLIVEYAVEHDQYSLCRIEEKYSYREYFDVEIPAAFSESEPRMFSYLERIAEASDLEDLLGLIHNHLNYSSLAA